MSHFVVYVTGYDVEEALAPFHEFESTGIDRFIQEVEDMDFARDVAETSLEEALDDYGYENRVVSDLSLVDRNGKHKYGYVLVQDGEFVSCIRRTNPNAKWDWYVVGGRWSGNIQVTKEAAKKYGSFKVNACLKREIDIESICQSAAEEAASRWDKVWGALSVAGITGWKSWEEVSSQFEDISASIDEARRLYRDQGHVAVLSNFPIVDYDQFLTPREEYVNRAQENAFRPFALLHDGKWYERGSMGWFGVVHGQKDTWLEEFQQIWDSIPEDMPITLVDCHI